MSGRRQLLQMPLLGARLAYSATLVALRARSRTP
jgi:hypothetical protein